MFIPVVMYGYESWTVKKAEHQRTDSFELWCWRRLLRVPWTARRSNQSILKEISSEYSLEGLMLKLKLQYFGHLMQRTNSLEKTLMLGKIEGGRTRGQQRMRWLNGITDMMDMSLRSSGSWWWTGKLACCSPWGSKLLDPTVSKLIPLKGLPRWHSSKESACQAGDLDSIPGSRKSPGEGNGYLLQYSCLEVLVKWKLLSRVDS